MKTWMPLVLALGFLAAPLGAQDMDTRPGVAVLPFTNGGSDRLDAQDAEALSGGLQQMLLTELQLSTDLRIVERSLLQSALAEQDLGSSGRVDSETAARVGRIVGARYMVAGAFVDLGGRFRMDARIIDTETTEILKAERVQADRDEIFDIIVDLASAVIADIDLPELPAALREERQEKEMPAEAVILYSNAQFFADQGDTERAIDLYRRFTERFPDYTEAGERLQQLTSG